MLTQFILQESFFYTPNVFEIFYTGILFGVHFYLKHLVGVQLF